MRKAVRTLRPENKIDGYICLSIALDNNKLPLTITPHKLCSSALYRIV